MWPGGNPEGYQLIQILGRRSGEAAPLKSGPEIRKVVTNMK